MRVRKSAALISHVPTDYIEFDTDTNEIALRNVEGFIVELWWTERGSRLIYPELAQPPQRKFIQYHARMDGHDGGDEQGW